MTETTGSCRPDARLASPAGDGALSEPAGVLDSPAPSGTELVTVAVRRVGLGTGADNLYDALRERSPPPAEHGGLLHGGRRRAHRRARAGGARTDLVKLEVLADPETLLPDVEGSSGARELVPKGFRVLPYTNDDP